MIKTLENGLKLLPSSDGKYSFLFDNSKSELCIDYIKTNNIKRVMLNPFHGFTAYDLKSIIPLTGLVEELIIGSEKINYSGLGEFHNLKLLAVPDNKKEIVDLKNFPKLLILNCSITDRIIGFENCIMLNKLTITDYKSKAKDLSNLLPLNNLEHLSFIKTDITSMQGIEFFSNLKKLEIFRASKLESIEALQALSNRLEEVQIEQCKKITDYETLRNVKSLKKIILSESGEVSNLSFLKELNHLEFISFWGTNVLDGDLSHCEDIDYVGFDNKKHYSHKFEYFKNKNKQ